MRTQPYRYRMLAWTLLGAVLLLAPVVHLTAAPAPGRPAVPPSPVDTMLDTLRADPPPNRGTATDAALLPPPADPIPLPNPVWRVGVVADGLYALDYATLAAAGVPVTEAAPADLHLRWRGQAVAAEVVGGADGTFDPGDRLVFYGQKFHGTRQAEKYTDENVYWLAMDAAAAGLRMDTRDVTPAGVAPPAPGCTDTVVAEENLIYWSRHSDNPGTVTTWFWDEANSPTTVTHTYPISLTAPRAVGVASLVIEVASGNYNDDVNPDHHMRLAFNDTALGDVYWDGKTGHVVTVSVPAAALLDGANVLQVAYVTDVGHQDVLFDRATLTYRREPQTIAGVVACEVPQDGALAYTFTGLPADVDLYDVSDPLRPVALTGAQFNAGSLAFEDAPGAGARYLAAAPQAITPTHYAPDATLLAPADGADEIVIAPRHFLSALGPLVAHRRAQGLRVRAVAVEDVYPLFNGGVVHPEAIRAFVAYAHAHWPGPAPRYLFVVGDGNFNPKGYSPAKYGAFVPSWIPPYLDFVDPDQGEVPLDARFGDVDGDGLPEVAVGHIPAQTVEQVTAYVDKVLKYAAQPPAAWQLHNLLVADNGKRSDEGYDTQLNRLAADFLPSAMTVEKVYMEDYCVGYSQCPSATQALLDGWNAGAGLLTYSGHASVHRWAHEPLIYNEDLLALTETDALPFVLALDCFDGNWMFPPEYPKLRNRDTRSVGEWATTVLTETGAIAAFGPSGLAYAAQEETLARAMYAAAFQQGVFDLGALTQVGRQAIAYSYIARTYTLLGDPALHLPWWAGLTLSPTRVTVLANEVVDLPALLDAQGDTRFGQTFAVTPTWTVDGVPLGYAGVFTAPAAPASVRLVAHLGPISATATLDAVTGPPVTVTVSPNPLRIAPSAAAQMTATPRDRLGNPTALTATVTWSSSIGTIDAGGLFTAPPAPAQGAITATVPVSQGTNTIYLSGVAAVEVTAGYDLYLPLVLRTRH